MSKDNENPRADGDRKFAEKAGALFRQSADELDAATLSRLNQARQAAISQVSGGKARFAGWSPWVPATGMAAAAAVAVVMWNGGRQIEPDMTFAPLAEVSDFEILLDEDSLDMLEDLEFYAWLGAESESEPDVG